MCFGFEDLDANLLDDAVFDEDFATFQSLEDVFANAHFNRIFHSELSNDTADRKFVQGIALRGHFFLELGKAQLLGFDLLSYCLNLRTNFRRNWLRTALLDISDSSFAFEL